jgi:hypothetical protein
MASKSGSIRLANGTFDRLTERGSQSGESAERLAQRYIEEGLRMDARPGIVFRDGPAGRRPALAAGPDIWEIIRVVRNTEQPDTLAIAEAAAYFELPVQLIRTAVEYAEEHREEIDRWLRMVDEEADKAETAWHQARTLAGR